MARYGQGNPWMEDVGFVLGTGVTGYGSPMLARQTGKVVIPAASAATAGVAALVAAPYIRHPVWRAVVKGVAGGGLGYAWTVAAANTFGKKAIPLVIPTTTSTGTSTFTAANVTPFRGSRRGVSAALPGAGGSAGGRSLAARGLAAM